VATGGAAIGYTQAPMKRGLRSKEAGAMGHHFIPAQLRARFKGGLAAARQTAGKYGVAGRGATLLTLT
jgi:hypothetical protein